MIEMGSAMYVGQDHTEEDLDAVRRFTAEYGDKIHSWIADERRIALAVEEATSQLVLDEEPIAVSLPYAETTQDVKFEGAVPVTGESVAPRRRSLASRFGLGILRFLLSFFRHD